MKTFLIIYSESNDTTQIVNRIQSIGDNINFLGNHYLVYTEDTETAQTIFDRISSGQQLTSVYVTEVSTTAQTNYWGVMNRDFWNWLATHPNTHLG